MGYGSLNGFARASITDPVGSSQCDRCRMNYNRTDLVPQYQWSGAGLIDTGLRVCKRKCLDRPFEQYRVLILPGDPIPTPYPRPDPNLTPPGTMGFPVPTPFAFPIPTDPYNQGFTPFQVGDVPPTIEPWQGAAGTPAPGGYPPGYPLTKPAVLASVAAVSGVPTPQVPIDQSIVFGASSVSQQLLPANPTRQWMLMYSPAAPMSGFSLGTAALGSMTTLMFGPGMAWFWATAQGLGTVYRGAVTAVGLTAGMPLWCWEYPAFNIGLADDGGVLVLLPLITWPSFPTGAGGFYSNGGVASVGPGAIYDPLLPPLVFGALLASALQLLNGAFLPQAPPPMGSGILWNPGGLAGGDIWVA